VPVQSGYSECFIMGLLGEETKDDFGPSRVKQGGGEKKRTFNTTGSNACRSKVLGPVVAPNKHHGGSMVTKKYVGAQMGIHLR